MAIVTVGILWFFIVVGASATLSFVYDLYDLIEEIFAKRKRNKMCGVAKREKEDLDFRCKVAAMNSRINSTDARINALQVEMEMNKYMGQIRQALEAVKEIYEELEPNEDKD